MVNAKNASGDDSLECSTSDRTAVAIDAEASH